MAAGIFNALHADGDSDAISAGLHVTIGEKPSPNAVRAVSRYGADISDHAATPMTDALAYRASVIIAMTRAHAEELRALYPFAASKVRILGELARNGLPAIDIPDPFGGTAADYRACAALIAACLEVVEGEKSS